MDEAQLVVGALGLGAALVAAFFAWRDWDRGRSLWRIDFQLGLYPKRHGELQRDNVLVLNVIVACRRNLLRVERIAMRRDKGSEPLRAPHTYPQIGPPASLQPGQTARAMFFSDDVAVAHRGPEGPFREVCWYDPEGKAHCRDLPNAELQKLVADSRL